MANIDYIMELLDWNNSAECKKQGVKLARDVKCINVFLQPGKPYGKSIWDNCAKILSERTDEELSPYLFALMEWLQDMNWPGAFRILNRIQRFVSEDKYIVLEHCIKKAKALKDDVWEENLNMVKDNTIFNISGDGV